MPRAKKKANPSRKKPFMIFGRFESSSGRQIEVWNGSARSMAVAMRRAIASFWRRPSVKWRHFSHVTITAHVDALAERKTILRAYKSAVKEASHGK